MEQKVDLMEQKMDLRPTSFRLSDDVTAKFKEFAGENKLNQSDALAALLSVAELNNAKGMVKDRGKEIETFQTKVSDLISMFTNSLLINQTSEERIREELSEEISKKDVVNANLVGQIEKLTKDLADQKAAADLLSVDCHKNADELKVAIKEREKLTAELDKMSGVLINYQEQINAQKEEIKALKELEEINTRISHALDEEKDKVVNLENALQVQDGKYKNALEQINFFKSELVASKEVAKAESDAIREQHKVDLAVLKEEMRQEIAENKAECKRSLTELKAAHSDEIKAIRDQYATEMAELKNVHSDEVKTMRDQHATEMAELKASHAAEIKEVKDQHSRKS